MIYYSKYLKYKNKYLKLKQIHGGDKRLHDEYEPKKIEVDMNLLKSFFKGTKFSEQDKIRRKYFDYYDNFSYDRIEKERKKILDNLFSLDKDLFCVFINILNNCATKEDQLKCYLAIERLKLNLIGDNYKDYLKQYKPKHSIYSDAIIRNNFMIDFLSEPDVYGDRHNIKMFLSKEVYMKFIDNLKNKTQMEFENLFDQVHTLSPELFILLKNIILNDNPSDSDFNEFKQKIIKADEENDKNIEKAKEDYKQKIKDFIQNHKPTTVNLDRYKFLDYLTSLDDYIKMGESKIDNMLNEIYSYNSRLYELFKIKILGTFSSEETDEYKNILLQTRVERLKESKPGPTDKCTNVSCIRYELVRSNSPPRMKMDPYYHREEPVKREEETFSLIKKNLSDMNEVDFQNLLILLDQFFAYMPKLYELYKNYLLDSSHDNLQNYYKFVKDEFKINTLYI
jgi:hypothetical protein